MADLRGRWGESSLNSSSSASTFGPVRGQGTPSSSRAHRGPYSRPASLNQSLLSKDSASRFSPYARKPIFVGAKKVVTEPTAQHQPHLTSTALKMIEILQRTTSPVVEGRRTVLESPSISKSRCLRFLDWKWKWTKGDPTILSKFFGLL